MMNIQLIAGELSSNDALDLITQMIHAKIKYYESKIINHTNEEDIMTSEAKIKRLQKDLFEFRKSTTSKNKKVKIEAFIRIE